MNISRDSFGHVTIPNFRNAITQKAKGRKGRNSHASYLKIHIYFILFIITLFFFWGGEGVAYSILSYFRGIYSTNASGVEQMNDTCFDQLAIYKH